jgi:hypothetical protein
MTDETHNFYESVLEKPAQQAEIERATQAFFDNGGAIKDIKMGIGRRHLTDEPEKYEKEMSEGGKKGARNANINKGYKVTAK